MGIYKLLSVLGLATLLARGRGSDSSAAEQDEDPASLTYEASLEKKWGFNWPFSGISTFGHLAHVRCLTHPEEKFDIGIIGVPFDSAVSYRPGARMGPRSIRTASARHLFGRGFNPHASVNPYASWARIIDCGDIPVTPLDSGRALTQMTEAFFELSKRKTKFRSDNTRSAYGDLPQNTKAPRFVTLGGDHLVALPALRALRAQYEEPIALLHFDAHLDTLRPESYPSAWSSNTSDFNHGTVFWQASSEGLIANGSVHAGINTRLSGVTWDDYLEDDRQGFVRIHAEDIDAIGISGVVSKVRQTLVGKPVYMSVDIDVLDPAFAPGTGAPEPGGWTTREILKILRGLGDLDIVGADVVEVSPPYDSPGSDTAFVASGIIYEILTNMVKQQPHHMESWNLQAQTRMEL